MKKFLLLGAVLCLCFTLSLHAQNTTSLGGRVTDKTGAVIPGASVTLTLAATGAVRTNTTNSIRHQLQIRNRHL